MSWFFETSHAVNSIHESSIGSASGDTEVSPQVAVSDDNELSISEMAEAFGVTMRTLRFYESKSLLAPRRIGNRRFYNDFCQARLRLVLKGKAMGLGLDEIAQMVLLVESEKSDADRAQSVRTICERQRDLLLARRDSINEQLEETARVIDGLTSL